MQHSNAQLHDKNDMSAKDLPKNSLKNQKGKKKQIYKAFEDRRCKETTQHRKEGNI